MHEQSIIDTIVSRLDLTDISLHCISLIADEKTVVEHLRNDIDHGVREKDVIERSLERLRLYGNLNTEKIDVSGLTIDQIVEKIVSFKEEENT